LDQRAGQLTFNLFHISGTLLEQTLNSLTLTLPNPNPHPLSSKSNTILAAFDTNLLILCLIIRRIALILLSHGNKKVCDSFINTAGGAFTGFF
jgi:hypothetical protein